MDDETLDPEEDIIPQELVESIERLDSREYNISEMIQETFLDLDQIVQFIEETEQFLPNHDDKLQKLVNLLHSEDLVGQKVLVFTEFADTARYIYRQLIEEGFDCLAQVDSSTKINRTEVIQRFSPYYNELTSSLLEEKGWPETRILISTDVLSEGLNLQDATHMINYDIHWNPVRLMQRIGRVDRRLNPEIEANLVADHPELATGRGTVHFWNFLPPDELNELLSLYTTVSKKTLLISKTMGIEGKKLLTPEDDYDALREFNQSYEGTKTVVEEMHLEYQALLKDNPGLESRLKGLPGGVFSGKQQLEKGLQGLFFCYALPAFDKESGDFSEAAGSTRWYFYDCLGDTILEEPQEIKGSIQSTEETPRNCSISQESLIEWRMKVEKHIKNSYLKRIDAPIGVKPKLKCWLELNNG
jgi:superfamily II DNA/RNA helicase